MKGYDIILYTFVLCEPIYTSGSESLDNLYLGISVMYFVILGWS